MKIELTDYEVKIVFQALKEYAEHLADDANTVRPDGLMYEVERRLHCRAVKETLARFWVLCDGDARCKQRAAEVELDLNVF